jgi:hypothetical protein
MKSVYQATIARSLILKFDLGSGDVTVLSRPGQVIACVPKNLDYDEKFILACGDAFDEIGHYLSEQEVLKLYRGLGYDE